MAFDFRMLKFQADVSRAKPAVIGRDKTLTWNELEQRVHSLAQRLRAYNLPPAHPVVIRGQKEADFVTAILACMVCELPYVPLDTVFPVERVKKIRSILGSTVLIQCGSAEPLDFPIEIRTQEIQTAPAAANIDAAASPISNDSLVYIIFTSGSTGEPKGVQITRGNILDLLEWVMSSDYQFTRDDVFINQCSFSFDVSFFDLLASLQNGATVILNAPEQIKNADEFTARLAPLSPTIWVSTPSFLSLALVNRDFNSQTLPKLKRFYLAGETLHHSLVRRTLEKFPSAKVFNAYGPTEATVIVTLVDVDDALMKKYSDMPIGRVKRGTRIELIDTFEQDGETVGELIIVGNNVAKGYYGRPDLTEQKFYQVDGLPAYRTGDHGYYKDEMVFFLGRIDNQIKLHGFRIELDEIDSHIMSVPGVELSVTVPLMRDGDVKKLVAFVKLRASAQSEAQTTADIKTSLATKVPAYMIPSSFHVVADFPYGASHKIDKKKLLSSVGMA